MVIDAIGEGSTGGIGKANKGRDGRRVNYGSEKRSATRVVIVEVTLVGEGQSKAAVRCQSALFFLCCGAVLGSKSPRWV